MASRYARALQSFPKGYSLAFAYGSGVFKQIGHQNVRAFRSPFRSPRPSQDNSVDTTKTSLQDKALQAKDNMMDFIVAVRDPQAWHQVNMAQNPKHYSSLRLGGPHFISRIQENWGAKIYFNTLIPTHEGMIKYGVISHSSLVADLLDWDTLYVAGRLHKPVLMLHKAEDEELHTALKLNLFFAVHTALLLLPELFSEEQLYMTLAGLSYAGDFRMYVGEDQNKVRNIVGAQIREFRALYTPILKELEEYAILDTLQGMGEQDTSPPARLYHLSMLPKRLQLMLIREWNKDGRSRDLEDVLRAAAHDTDVEDVIHRGIQDIVKISSLTQSIKGIMTAGATKSVRYSWSKVKKMWKSLQR